MIIYSPVPLEVIFEGIETSVQTTKHITVNGLLMQVKTLNDNEAEIVRIITPETRHYLNPAYAPGQIIRFLPQL